MSSSVVSSARGGSKMSEPTRPIYLMERCLAVRFERLSSKMDAADATATPKTPSTTLNRINRNKGWLPWQRGSATSRVSSELTSLTPTSPTSPTPPTPPATTPLALSDAATPQGWIYDGGFVLFQNFQEANGYCYWNTALLEAVTSLKFVGHVTPSTILVTSEESCLETVRGAWARKVLRAPSSYTIVLVGDVEGCAVQPISQSQFTPLPEALCWVVWELNLAERSTALEHVVKALANAFPDLVPPSDKVVYDTLGKLIRERKIFFTGRGYGVVTPYTYWKTSVVENEDKGCLLLTNEEALARAHGIVESYPHGTVVDKAVQTNLVDVICRGNGTDKVLFGRTLEELAPQSTSQRHRSLRMFHVSSSRRMSWSELKGGGSSTGSGGSLKLSQAKAKKLMEECGADDLDDWGVHRVHSPAKTNKEKVSLLSRLFRKSSMKKRPSSVSSSGGKSSSVKTFCAQFPPPEWFQSGGTVRHMHSVAVQTQTAVAAQSTLQKYRAISSGHSECSTSMSLSSPTPSRRSYLQQQQRRITLTHPSANSCTSFRNPVNSGKLTDEPQMSRLRTTSPATSISSGLGRSFSPASAHSYQRPSGGHRSPSPTRSTDSLYSSSVGPSASALCRSPVPSFVGSKSLVGGHTLFQRSNPVRSSFGDRYGYATASNRSNILPGEYQPFPRNVTRSLSYRQPKSIQQHQQMQMHQQQEQEQPKPLGHSTPRPYTSQTTRGDAVKPLVTKANIRDQFFQTPLAAPPLISSIISQPRLLLKPSAFSAPKSAISAATSSKKYYETDLDLTIKVPAKNGTLVDDAGYPHADKNANCNESSVTSSASRVINISVTKSQSLNFDTNLNKENAEDVKNNLLDKTNCKNKPCDDTFRTFPSLTELNINFKSITGQKILQGLNSNSTDTLVEVNMRDGDVKADLAYI